MSAPEKRPELEWPAIVDGLRRAAEHLEPCTHGATVSLLVSPRDARAEDVQRATFPPAIGRPLHSKMLAVAEDVERARSTIGRPISYVLEIAGALLGEDLGHNR